MGKVRFIAPRLAVRPLRISRRTDSEGHVQSATWRRWYNQAEWCHPEHGLRIRVLRRDLFTCQWPGCGKIELDTSQLVGDHKTPHRGDRDLFFDEDNVWTLCAPCHNRLKQREERRRG